MLEIKKDSIKKVDQIIKNDLKNQTEDIIRRLQRRKSMKK